MFIADINHEPYLSIERVTKLVNQINELHPYIILMGDDYVHRAPKYIKPVFDEFLNLKSKLGNHDHWENAELIRKMLVRNGINICGKKSYYFKIGNDSIKIGGVRDFWEDVQVIDSTTSYLKKSDFLHFAITQS